MNKISYRRIGFLQRYFQRAVWLPFPRFPLSYRDVEDLLAERGAMFLTRRYGAGL